jgi:hypothetical protein
MSNTFKWVDIKEEQPTLEGKYLVKTRTKMGNIHRLDSHMSINKGKVHFNVSNQIVTHWLKEI